MKNRTRCRVTNVSDELGSHHFMPDINYGKRKHVVLTNYRYVFLVFDHTNDLHKGLLDLLNSKCVNDNSSKYAYCVDEKQYSLVFSAKLEADVRYGDVSDVMLAKNYDSVLLKMKQGKNVSVYLQDDDDNLDKLLYEGEGLRYEVILKREKEGLLMKRSKSRKLYGLSQRAKVFEDKERQQVIELQEYEDQSYRYMIREKLELYKINNFKATLGEMGRIVSTNLEQIEKELHLKKIASENLVKTLLESWDWDTYENEAKCNEYIPASEKMPKPCKISQIIIQQSGPKFIEGQTVMKSDGLKFVAGNSIKKQKCLYSVKNYKHQTVLNLFLVKQ